MRNDAGVSLVEVLVALAITVAVTALACALAVEAQTTWQADSGRVDLQQRARVATDLLSRALRESGLGPAGGPAGGPLIRVLAPVVPRRIGTRDGDPPEAFRTDVLTVVRVVPEAESGVLLTEAAPGAGVLELAACAVPACGFVEGSHAMLFDSTGNHDVFTVRGVAGHAITVRHHGTGNPVPYAAGSPVVAVESSSYYLAVDSRTLRVYNGDSADFPLLDDVVGMRVEYYGEALPPRWPRPPAGNANCLYAADGTYQAGLMPELAAPGGIAVLTPDLLTDGPWCGSGGNRFDADLLRVRRVRVTVRLQAADPATRGPDLARFHHPGSARKDAGMVPDLTFVIEVAPPNLVQGW